MQLYAFENNRRQSKNQGASKTNTMELNEGTVVLCTVKKIEKTNIFLDIEDNGEGIMVLSEVAAGRIRNLREYVFPNKKIVCKILNIENGHVQLSLRRVTGKERDEVLEHYKREKRLISMIKAIAKQYEGLTKKIKEKYDLVDFFEKAKNSPLLLKEFFNNEEIEKLTKILTDRIEKEKLVKKLFKLTSYSSTGISDIKEILKIKDTEINYLGSSKFSIIVKANDFKEANKKLVSILEQIKQKAKEKHAVFEIIEK